MTGNLDDRSNRGVAQEDETWSNATWGSLAGIAVLLLVLIFAFGRGEDEVATRTEIPSATTGQRTIPAPPVTGPKSDAPTMNRPTTDGTQQPSAPDVR